jgi:hypothetical protein
MPAEPRPGSPPVPDWSRSPPPTGTIWEHLVDEHNAEVSYGSRALRACRLRLCVPTTKPPRMGGAIARRATTRHQQRNIRELFPIHGKGDESMALPSEQHLCVAVTASPALREQLRQCEHDAATEFAYTMSIPDAQRLARRARIPIIGVDQVRCARSPLHCPNVTSVLVGLDTDHTAVTGWCSRYWRTPQPAGRRPGWRDTGDDV